MPPSDQSAGAEGQTPASKLLVFMFTDVADSTRLKSPSSIGAAAYAELARRHDALFREIAGAVTAAEILKDVGDGFMATFPTASDAVRASLRLQFAIHADPAFTPGAAGGSLASFRVRVGIHQGEVSVLDLDIHGKPKLVGPAADMAARIQSLALPGQTLVSRSVFNDARHYVREHPACGASERCPSLEWDFHGQYRFKGVEEPQEVFEVGGAGVAPLKAPPDNEKARYVGSLDDEVMRGWRPATAQEIPGRQHWVLQRQLGEGGFGEVWLATHKKTRACRVFKFCFDPVRLRSFRREITLFRLLREALGDRHDIAKLHEFQLDRPPFYLESEFSELGDLDTWAKNLGGIDRVAIIDRLEIIARVAEAVAAAHSVGVLHKDLKPSNILMVRGTDGAARPCLADFGIGVLTDRTQLDARGITVAGFTEAQLTDNRSSRSGTRLYAPPETMIGQAFSAQGDVYALGVMLYQVVVGDLQRPVGEGWSRDVEDETIREDIARCIDRDVKRRLGNPLELALRLRSLDRRRAEAAERARLKDQADRAARAEELRAMELRGMAAERDRALEAEQRATQHLREAVEARDIAVREATRASTMVGFVLDLVAMLEVGGDGRQRTVFLELLRTAETAMIEQFAGQLRSYPDTQVAIRQAVARAYLRLGDVVSAARHFGDAIRSQEASAVPADQVLIILLAERGSLHTGSEERAIAEACLERAGAMVIGLTKEQVVASGESLRRAAVDLLRNDEAAASVFVLRTLVGRLADVAPSDDPSLQYLAWSVRVCLAYGIAQTDSSREAGRMFRAATMAAGDDLTACQAIGLLGRLVKHSREYSAPADLAPDDVAEGLIYLVRSPAIVVPSDLIRSYRDMVHRCLVAKGLIEEWSKIDAATRV